MNLTDKQREIILTNNKTLLVSASAGSGKTFVVVEKIVNDIIKNKTDISNLLIVTFTNAAASELKERIVKRLQEVLSQIKNAGDNESVYYISKQINKAWNANISTIHSFCLSIIKDNFYILGIDPNVTTMDETRASILLAETIQEIIEQEYEEKNQSFYDTMQLLGKEESLQAIATKLYSFLSHITDKETLKKEVIAAYELKDVKDLSETKIGQEVIYDIKNKLEINKLEIKNCIEDIEGVDEFSGHKSILEKIYTYLSNIIKENSYDKIYYLLKNGIELNQMPRYKGTDIETKDNILRLKKETLDAIKECSKILYKDTESICEELRGMTPVILWLFEFVEKIRGAYFNKKLKKGVIDFSDYEELAIKALENKEVTQKYKEKFKTIYVDEYQDTSYAQEAIISKIANLDNCIMVGDVKQSIYGFRNAAPELFSTKYEAFSEDTKSKENLKAKIVLAENFRSRKEVIQSINDIFETIMTLKFGGARYTEKETLKYGGLYGEQTNTEQYKTEINLVEYSKLVEDTETEALSGIEVETKMVAKKIKDLVNNFKVYDIKAKEYRKCEYKDIVILLQVVNNVADKIVDGLRGQNIPAYANIKSNFYETEEIKLVINFLKILDNPLDDIALSSVMYSIIGKFSLDELYEIRCVDKSFSVYESLINYNKKNKDVTDILVKKVNSFLELIERFKKYLYVYTISEVILKLYMETGLYEAIMLEVDGQSRKLNMDALLQIARQNENSSNMTLYSFIQYIESIQNSSKNSDAPTLIGENENVVRIMSIHHSKGLEFPVVILMNTSRIFKFPDTKDRILLDKNFGIGVNVLNKEFNVTYPSIINMAIKSNIKYRQKSELLRLLYVALTRAKEKLIIYGTVKDATKYVEDIQKGVQAGRVSQAVLQQNNSHLKNILSGYLAKEGNNNFILNILNSTNAESNLNEVSLQKFNPIDSFEHKMTLCGFKADPKQLDEISSKLDIEYKYNKSSRILQKYTATKINDENKEQTTSSLNLEELRPTAMRDNISGAGFGTCIHKIIEKLDIANATYEDVVKQAVQTVTSQGMNSINIDNVSKKIYKMMQLLKQDVIKPDSSILHEYEFIIKDTLTVDGKKYMEEPSLIQGIIDMYVETEGRSIILDFKTDKVNTKEELIKKYATQLNIYRRGIELGLNKKEVEVYIYSFSLEHLLKL